MITQNHETHNSRTLSVAQNAAVAAARLGNTANISSAMHTEAVKTPKKNRNLIERYRYLSHAQRLLSDANVRNRSKSRLHRTCSCHAYKSFVADSIEIRTDGKNCSYSGLQTCGSVWACPVCAARIAVERAGRIQKAIQWAKENKLIPVLVSFTTYHHFESSLRWLLNAQRRAWQYFSNGRPWRRIMKKFGMKRWIMCRETTFGENGWHPHMHGLFFASAALVMAAEDAGESLEDFLKKRWMKACEREGLYASYERGCDVRADSDVKASYLAKMGVSQVSGHMVYEMTGNQNKGRSHWQLLRSSMRFNGGDGEEDLDGQRYTEFVRESHGRNWITWSDGFADEIGLNDVTDEVLAEDSGAVEKETLYAVSDVEWIPVRWLRRQSELLELATETQSPLQIKQYLRSLREEFLDKLGDRVDSVRCAVRVWDSLPPDHVRKQPPDIDTAPPDVPDPLSVQTKLFPDRVNPYIL